MLCDVVETVREVTYLGDWVSAGGGFEAAVTALTRCGWVRFRECSVLLYGSTFPQILNEDVYKSYIRPSILYGINALCLKEGDILILRRTEKSKV